MTNLYLFLLKENQENIELANSYYLTYYLLICFIYFNKHSLIICDQLELLAFSNEIGPYDLLLFIIQNIRLSYYTSIFHLLLSSISIVHLVMSSLI